MIILLCMNIKKRGHELNSIFLGEIKVILFSREKLNSRPFGIGGRSATFVSRARIC